MAVAEPARDVRLSDAACRRAPAPVLPAWVAEGGSLQAGCPRWRPAEKRAAPRVFAEA